MTAPFECLFVCSKTGNMAKPWLDAGHPCTLVDLQHPAGEHTNGLLTTIGADIIAWRPTRRYGFAFGEPPCTDLAVSGARWFAAKGPAVLARALMLVSATREILELSGAEAWAIENPVGRLSTHWRKPDYTFDPCDFGGYLDPPSDHYTKRSCLWTSSSFAMPARRPVSPTEGSKMHRVPPGPNRQNIRSAAPMGFARAVFEANRNGGRVVTPHVQASLFDLLQSEAA